MQGKEIPISALQHFVYCPRQCALIHTERVWAENALTMLGSLEHARVDSGENTLRDGVRTVRALHLVCHRLGIWGVADAVEYTVVPPLSITPIEYKHGRPKLHPADEVQLCAQALCLEEMHSTHIEQAYLYYRGTRKRHLVLLTPELRARTEQAVADTRSLLESGILPPAERHDGCGACSLVDICLPATRRRSVSAYNAAGFAELLDSHEETS